MKTCSKCKEEKANSNFHISSKEKDGLQKQCKSCQSKRKKEWYKENKEKALNDNYKYKYGISLEEYSEKLREQNHKCKICKKDETEVFKQTLYVDHNHDTGEVRGLLCHPCNAGLGHFKEQEDLLEAAKQYIKEYKNV